MEFLNVIAAAVAAYAFGALWYMALARQWIEDSGISTDEKGKPINGSNPFPYILAFLSALVVAGMMRHVFQASGVESVGAGLVSGFGIGLFLASPWLATCYSFGGRPKRLILIDAGFATFSNTIIGGVLTLF